MGETWKSQNLLKKMQFLQSFNIYTEESIRFGTNYDQAGSKKQSIV